MPKQTPANFRSAELFSPANNPAQILPAPKSSAQFALANNKLKQSIRSTARPAGIDRCFIEKIIELAQEAHPDKLIWQDIFQAVYAACGIKGVHKLTDSINFELKQNGSEKEISLTQQKEDADFAIFAIQNMHDGSTSQFDLRLHNHIAENIAQSIATDCISQQETERAYWDAYQKEGSAGILLLESYINRRLISLHRQESVETQPSGLEDGSLYFIIKSPGSESGFLIFPQEHS